jgi:uncharacterized protein involved in exopolysaccharide biosynthesis
VRETQLNVHSDGVSVSEYVQVVWRSRWWIAAAALLSALVAAATIYTRPAKFRATAMFAVSGPDAPTAVSTGRVLLREEAVAHAVVSKTGLDQAPLSMTAESFLAHGLVIDNTPGTSLLKAQVTVPDPRLAAAAARQLATAAVEFAKRSQNAQAQDALDRLKAALDEAKHRREELAGKVAEERRDAQLDVRRGELDARVRQQGSRGAGSPLDPVAVAWANEIYAREMAVATLEADLEAATKVYGEVFEQYEKTQLGIGDGNVRLTVIDAAMPVTRVTEPGAPLLVLLAILFGVFTSIAVVLSAEYLKHLVGADTASVQTH